MNRFVVSASLVAVAAGCDGTSSEPPASPERTPVVVTEGHWSPPDPSGEGLDVEAALPRRLSVAQLERSLEVIGGFPEGSIELPQNLAQALGQPDFQSVTTPSRDPSPLFMKFMVDLAGFVCGQIVEADRQRTASERVLARYDDSDQNLRSIWLRFTGISGAAADDDIARLARVEAEATADTGSAEGGRWAVCIAAVTSPEFLLY